jgi:hypothetical protein
LPDYQKFVIEILSTEGVESSKIENEILDRESLRSSIRQHLGLKTPSLDRNKESGIAKLLYHVYESFNQPLTHEMIANGIMNYLKFIPILKPSENFALTPSLCKLFLPDMIFVKSSLRRHPPIKYTMK